MVNYAVIGSIAIVASAIFYLSFRKLDKEQARFDAIRAGRLTKE